MPSPRVAGRERSLGEPAPGSAARAARAVLRAAPPGARPDERRRLGRRVLRRGRGPSPPAGGRAGRCGATPRSRRSHRPSPSGCVLAAVRSATPGMPPDETAAAPFQHGRWLLSHNGVVDRAVLGPHPAAESVCDSAQLAAHLFDFGPERAGEFVTDVGKRDPGRPAEPAAHRRRADPRDPVDRLPVRAAHRRTASRSPASHSTTTRAGPTSPSTTSSRSGRARCPSPNWRYDHDASFEPCPGSARPVPGGATRRCNVRPDLDAEDPPAQVLLRRARQRALRRDHPAARVLPDPGGDRDPAAHAGEIARLSRLRVAGRAGQRHVGQDRAAAAGHERRPARCASSSRSTSIPLCSPKRPRRWRNGTRGSDRAVRRRLRARPGRHPAAARAA